MSDDFCEECGRLGTDMPHEWTEDTCLLPHNYSKPKHPPARKIGWACTSCVDKHHDWLVEIVDLYATLSAVLDPGSVPDTTAEHGHIKKQPASPAPMRLDAWALLHPGMLNFQLDNGDGTYTHTQQTGTPDVRLILANWAQAVYDALSEGTATAPDTVSGAGAVLQTHDETLYRLPDIDTYDAELAWVRTALRNAHGITSRKPVGKCPTLNGNGQACDGPLWADPSGRMEVTCGRCGRHFNETLLSHLGGMIQAS